jgi:serine/threonine-protein kinase
MPSTEESTPSVATLAVEETSAATDTADLIEETLGKYRLIRHLATGGMAEIYLAEQVGPEGFAKEIVIKRILPHLAKDEQFTNMFLDEARLAAKLNHPNIGQIHELGREGGDYYIAMEYIDGASMEELMADRVELPFDVAARIVADTLQALDFAHESTDRQGKPLGIVHRDVTPSNIMASVDGIVKLVDFGVAKAAKKSHKTQTGAVKGKFAYMAPEQVESSDVDRRADIFAIGIVFYELLTGRRPFGEELAAVSKILHEDPPDPARFRSGIPDPYVQIVMRALQKDADKRYPTAHTMLLDIETALRMRNSYVGPREISAVVREYRGMDVPAGADLSALDTGVFAADRSAELPAARVTELEKAPPTQIEDIGTMETAAAVDVDTSDEERTDREADAEASDRPSKRALPEVSGRAAGIGAAVVLLLVAATAGGSWFAGRETTSPLVTGEPQTVVLNTTPLVEGDARPDELRDENGVPVLIDTVPATRVFAGRDFVGMTPLQTTLKPGRHRIELEHGDERKRVTVRVDGDARFDRHLFDFAALGEDAPEPKSKRKKRRRNPGARLKARIKSLF